MSTFIEEIRAGVKRLIDQNAENPKGNEAESDVYEYALCDVLSIIDEVEKEHPVPADIEREMKEAAENAPCCDFCHESDIRDREEWCKEKFGHFYAAGMLAEREQLASLPTIKGYVARDGHGSLEFSSEKPSRLEWCGWKLWKITRGTPVVVLPNTLFPDLRWEDEPREVEIIIKEVEK